MASRTELAKFEASSFRADRSVLITAEYTQNLRRVYVYCDPHRGQSPFSEVVHCPMSVGRVPRGEHRFDTPRDRAAALPGASPCFAGFPCGEPSRQCGARIVEERLVPRFWANEPMDSRLTQQPENIP